MVDLGRQPFLLSLRQAVDETGDLSGYETLLHEQYSAFKVYLREICNSDIPAQKRYEFLQTADYSYFVRSTSMKCATYARCMPTKSGRKTLISIISGQ